MVIDLNKKYQTKDGRPVVIYAVDCGDPFSNYVHGAIYHQGGHGWRPQRWGSDGKCFDLESDLIEVTLAEQIRDQIPWSALEDWVQFVAMNKDGRWFAYSKKPSINISETAYINLGVESGSLYCVKMPEVNSELWQETLTERPVDC